MSMPFRLARRCFAVVALTSVIACGDSPMSPDPVGAAQESTNAMLAQILAKLETIEARIDSLETTVEATGGGELVLTGLPAAQLDSIIELTSFIALESSSGGFEFCGELALEGKVGVEVGGEAEGRAAGDVGAWAGTGAHAGAKAKLKWDVKGGAELGLAGKIEGCLPLGGEEPPVRPAPAGPARSPELDALAASFASLSGQLDFSQGAMTQSLDGLGGVFSSPGSLTLASATSFLPMPAGLASLTSDPMGSVLGRVPALGESARTALCSGGWGSQLSTVVQEACGTINAGGISMTVLADISTSFPLIETTVGDVCNRVNGIGLQRLVISSWDVTILGSTYQAFPGYNQRLFPSYTSLACP